MTSYFFLCRALIFGMTHCLVDLYKVCLNCGPVFQNGPAAGDVGFKYKIYLKYFFPELLGSDAEICMKHCLGLVVLY